MSHEFDSGFSVRQPMWHGLGNVLAEYPETPEAACTAAETDWLVEKRPALLLRDLADAERDALLDRIISAVASTRKTFGGYDRQLAAQQLGSIVTPEALGVVTIPNRAATFRMDTQTPLGFVSDDYEVVQNVELYRFVDALVRQTDEPVEFETGGSLKGGAIVWALCRLPARQFQIPGTDDRTDLYVTAFTGHDGRTPFTVTVGDVRIVCYNTFRMNLNRHVSEWTVRHVGNTTDRLDEARQSLGLALEWRSEFEDLARQLAETSMSAEDLTAYADLMIPQPTLAVSERVRQNALDRRNKFVELFELQGARGGDSSGDFSAIAGTRWAGLQAATEYFDWHTRVIDTTGDGPLGRRFCRSMIDNEDFFKRQAVECLTQDDIPSFVSEKLSLN